MARDMGREATTDSGRVAGSVRVFLLPHAPAVALLLVLAVTLWWLQRPASVLDMNSDMHNICSFAMGLGDPARYADDPLLSNAPRYTPLYIWLVRVTARIAGGFPEGTALLVAPTSFLFMAGCYFLFWRLTGGRVLAVGVTVVLASVRIWFQLGEKWSMSEIWGIMPRTQFTLFLPWLLLLAWECRRRCRLWPLVAGLASVLVYVHPVSAPAWGLAIWCGLVLGADGGVAWKDRLKWGLLSAVLAAAVAAPFAVRYGGGASKKPLTADQKAYLANVAKQRFSPGLMDMKHGFDLVWQDISGTETRPHKHKWIAVWGASWAVLGAIVGLRRRDGRRRLLFLLIALTAFAVITVLIPLTDSIAAQAAERKPRWYDLSRGIRYWPLWLLLFGAMGLGTQGKSAKGKEARRVGQSWLVAAVALPTMVAAFWTQIEHGAGRLFLSRDANMQEERVAVAGAIDFIRGHTPPNGVFYGPFWLRHTPARPVCHSWKEATSLMGSFEKTRAWVRRMQQEGRLKQQEKILWQEERRLRKRKMPQDEKRASWKRLQRARVALWQQKVATWKEWGAQYVLQSARSKPREAIPRLKIEFENRHWFVARLDPAE